MVKPSRRICLANSLSSWGCDRRAQPVLVRAAFRPPGRPAAIPEIPSVDHLDGGNLDGLVEETGAVFEAKFMLPWSFSEQAAAEKHMAQLQHNMMWWDRRTRCCRSSPAAANGLRSRSPPTRSTRPPDVRREEILARVERRRAPSPVSRSSHPGPGLRRSKSSK